MKGIILSSLLCCVVGQVLGNEGGEISSNKAASSSSVTASSSNRDDQELAQEIYTSLKLRPESPSQLMAFCRGAYLVPKVVLAGIAGAGIGAAKFNLINGLAGNSFDWPNLNKRYEISNWFIRAGFVVGATACFYDEYCLMQKAKRVRSFTEDNVATLISEKIRVARKLQNETLEKAVESSYPLFEERFQKNVKECLVASMNEELAVAGVTRPEVLLWAGGITVVLGCVATGAYYLLKKALVKEVSA